MNIKRRRFLTLGLASSAVLAVGASVGLGLRGTTMVPVPEGLTILNPRQFSIFHALAQCIVEPGEGMPSIDELETVSTIDHMLSEAHPEDVTQVLQALMLLENALAGFLLEGRYRTFSGSSLEAQRQVLEQWRTSGLTVKRQAFQALHGLCVTSYWGHPKAYAFAGYSGPPDFSFYG